MATTSSTRARRFIAGVARVEKKLGNKGMRRTDEPQPDRLVVAACGSLLEPARAMTERVWLHDPEADPIALTDLLAFSVRVRRDRGA